MEPLRALWPLLRSSTSSVFKSTLNISRARGFCSGAVCQTDGVYRELTSMRVKIPWVEALQRQRDGGTDPTKAFSTPSAPPDRDLSPKKMAESYHSVILPLAQNPWLLDNYMNSSGHIRLGTIFMDLDALSGVVAYKHTGESVMTVTAAVDRITIKHPLKELCDLELSGQVTFATGRSSMEISMQVSKAPAPGCSPEAADVFMTCAFTMVSLDPSTKKPVPIAPLKIDTPEEQRLFNLGQKNYEAKKALSKTNLRKAAPNNEESDLIHSIWLKQLEYLDPNQAAQKPDNMVYMDHTKLHTTQIMQPQYRNRHNFMIFGGFLLKSTFELAFCCAASFSHSRPAFISLDPSTFENPVPVGSVLYLGATVTYTEDGQGGMAGDHSAQIDNNKYTRVQIRVDSKVRDIEHGHTKPTGQFHYTFLVEKDIKVMPRTYSEFMIWTDAKRRAHRVNESIESSEAAIQRSGGRRSDQGSRVTE